MKPTPEGLPSSSPIQRHPPERGQRNKGCVVLYSCCCCCCCCLHTIGGAVGAVLGGNYQPEPDRSVSPPKTLPSVQGLYWSSCLLALLLGVVIMSVLILQYGNPGNPWILQENVLSIPLLSAEWIGISFILAGPLWLLAGCLVMAARLGLRHELRSQPEYWHYLGWIAARMVVGSLIGIGVMWLLFVLLWR